MSPAEHCAAAERLLSAASHYSSNPAKYRQARSLVPEAELLTAQAQVHATLALAGHLEQLRAGAERAT